MANKQTAVEWLENALAKKLKHIVENKDFILMETLFEQAKQMEKEQIEMAFAKSYLIGLAEVNYDDVNKASEQYYNENYGK